MFFNQFPCWTVVLHASHGKYDHIVYNSPAIMNIRTFVAKSAVWFSENDGGSNDVWNFSRNSSVLVWPYVPYIQTYIGLHHLTFGLVRSLAVVLGRGKYGGNGGNPTHFGNIIISPDRRPDPGHVEKLSLRYLFLNTFTTFNFFHIHNISCLRHTYCPARRIWH